MSDLVRFIITYLVTSLIFLIIFIYSPLNLEVPKKYKKYKEILEVLFCLYWPLLLIVCIKTLIRYMKDREDE